MKLQYVNANMNFSRCAVVCDVRSYNHVMLRMRCSRLTQPALSIM